MFPRWALQCPSAKPPGLITPTAGGFQPPLPRVLKHWSRRSAAFGASSLATPALALLIPLFGLALFQISKPFFLPFPSPPFTWTAAASFELPARTGALESQLVKFWEVIDRAKCNVALLDFYNMGCFQNDTKFHWGCLFCWPVKFPVTYRFLGQVIVLNVGVCLFFLNTAWFVFFSLQHLNIYFVLGSYNVDKIDKTEKIHLFNSAQVVIQLHIQTPGIKLHTW